MSNQKPPSSRSFATLAFQPLTIPVIDFATTRVGLGHDDLNDPSVPVVLQAQLDTPEARIGNLVTLFWDDVEVQKFPLEQSHFDSNFISLHRTAQLPGLHCRWQPDPQLPGAIHQNRVDPAIGESGLYRSRRRYATLTVNH